MRLAIVTAALGEALPRGALADRQRQRMQVRARCLLPGGGADADLVFVKSGESGAGRVVVLESWCLCGSRRDAALSRASREYISHENKYRWCSHRNSYQVQGEKNFCM